MLMISTTIVMTSTLNARVYWGGFYFLIPLTRLGSLKLYIDIEGNYSTLANKILFRYNIRIYGTGLIIYGLYVYCLFYLQQCPK